MELKTLKIQQFKELLRQLILFTKRLHVLKQSKICRHMTHILILMISKLKLPRSLRSSTAISFLETLTILKQYQVVQLLLFARLKLNVGQPNTGSTNTRKCLTAIEQHSMLDKWIRYQALPTS